MATIAGEDFSDLVVGDRVIRLLGGSVSMEMEVAEVTEDRIRCKAVGTEIADWEFDRKTGVEEDEFLRWGVKFRATGSFLRRTEALKAGVL